MSDRVFSESVQYQAVLSNLEKNNGQLKCAICGKVLVSKSDCRETLTELVELVSGLEPLAC